MEFIGDLTPDELTARIMDAASACRATASSEDQARFTRQTPPLISPVENWNEAEFGPLSVENICRQYARADWREERAEPTPRWIVDQDGHILVRWNAYEDAPFVSSGVAFGDRKCIVLHVEMRIAVGDETATLTRGESCTIKAGAYGFAKINEGRLELGNIFKLPAGALPADVDYSLDMR